MPGIGIGPCVPFVATFGGKPKLPVMTGNILWLRADLGVTLNGSDVAAHANQATLGGSVAQGTALDQPAFNVAGFGGKDSITYDNVNDFMVYDGAKADFDFLHDGTGGTVVVIIKPQVAGATGYVFDTSNGKAATRVGAGMFWHSGGTCRYYVCNGGGTLVVDSSISALAAGVGGVVVMRNKTGASDEFDIRVNGVQTANGAFVGAAGGGNCFRQLVLGEAVNTEFGGELPEVAMYNRYLSDAECVQFETYATARYGL